MSTTINPDATLGQLVTEEPTRASVFETVGLDFCCGGSKTLVEACREKSLDVSEVQHLLSQKQQSQAASPNPADMGLTELVDHIEATHHSYLRETLPVLLSMSGKVARAHAAKDPRLAEVEQVLHTLCEELTSHLMKEEKVLFPAIRRIEREHSLEGFACGPLVNPIGVMELEHEDAGHALERLHKLTDAYAVPEWACNTCRGLMAELARFEKDMHLHIHKENNILFPRALAKESAQ